jgi:AcrR family transcriptional regulator
VARIYHKRSNTRLEIIRLAARTFLEKGYTKVSAKHLAEELDLSPGNITFYFPTKEHLLAVVVDMLFEFQELKLEAAANEGQSSLLAYCLALATIVAVCEENEAARDFFVASYSSELTLDLIRRNDTEKTKRVFSAFRPDWEEKTWEATENVVSGIEYGTIVTREEKTPLPVQIERALDAILTVYGVPKDTRETKIAKVLAMDYRGISRNLFLGFRTFIDEVTEESLREAMEEKRRKRAATSPPRAAENE